MKKQQSERSKKFFKQKARQRLYTKIINKIFEATYHFVLISAAVGTANYITILFFQ